MSDIDTKKSYLGDGAFVQIGSFHGEIVLTTEDGISVQNRVVLGPMELKLLIRWLGEREMERNEHESEAR